MKVVDTMSYKGKTYMVIDLEISNEFGYRFGTIDADLIVGDKLTQTVNGLQMAIAVSVEEAKKNRKDQVDYKEMLESGMTPIQILTKMMEGK